MLNPPDTGNLPEKVIATASEWFVRLSAEECTPADHQAWQAWLAASPLHQHAWKRIELLNQQFGQFDQAAGFHALSTPLFRRRRTVLKSFAFVLTAGASAALIQQFPLQVWTADQRTAVGQRRQTTLEDGSQLSLNTDSAVDISYNNQIREIKLRRGEIHIATHADPHLPARSLVVSTPAGRIVALGTQFSVYWSEDRAHIHVSQGSVRLEPALAANLTTIVPAGMSSTLDAHRASIPTAMPTQQHAWLDGMLYADNMRLDELIAALARYQPGFLSCDPAVGALRISGAYPLSDIERSLSAIKRVLPVRTERRTAYWTRIIAR